MSVSARLRSWLRAVFSRPRLEREMDEELAFHLESYTQELIRRGVASEEAARQARMELGGIAVQKENMRASLGLRLWDDLRADLRYALRMLAKSPGFTVVAIGSLALGIGANTAIFTITRTALLEDLPIPHAEELRQLRWIVHGTDQPMDSVYGWIDKSGADTVSSSAFSTEAYRRLSRQNTVFRDLVAWFSTGRMEVAFGNDVEARPAAYVSGNFFSALELKPQLGRLLLPADDSAIGKSSAVVLSDQYWQSRFSRSPSVIGKTLEVNQVPLTIVGVAPAGFYGLYHFGNPSIFLPLSIEPVLLPNEERNRLTDPESWWMSIFGRIRPGVSDAQAAAALAGVFHATVKDTLKPRHSADLNSMRLEVSPASHGENPFRHQVLEIDSVLTVLAFLVLLLACANLANLLLARAAARQKEVSVRIALGAGGARILRQLFTENLLLALSAGAAGTALGYTGRNLAPLLGQPVPKFDLPVLGFALGLSLLTCLFFGILPAWRTIHVNAQEGMRETTQMPSKRSKTRLAKSLVIVQVALSVILVAGAGLFMQTLRNLMRVQLGFQPERLLLFNLSLVPSDYKTETARAAAYEEINKRLVAIPGAISASYSTDALIDGDTSTSNFDVDGQPKGQRRAWENIVGPHFLTTLGIPLIAGREFGRQDTTTSEKVAVINQQLAYDFFPNQNPIGQTFNSDHTRIIGICGNTRFKDLRDTPPPTYYLFSRQVADYGPGGQMTFVVKTASDPAAITTSVRRAIYGFDRNLPIYRIRTQEEQIDETLHAEKLFAYLTSAFGLLALALACIGIYGLMAYTVARRTNEIGIRLALGAPRGRVMGMVLGESFRLAMIGIAAGTGMTLFATRSLQSMLFGLKPHDPLTFLSTGLLLLAVALLASFVPARAAAKVNPIQALRHE